MKLVLVLLSIALIAQASVYFEGKDLFEKLAQDGQKLNLRPIIGVYTEPSSYKEYPQEQYSYIAASYVKYLEMAGAQVVYVPYDADQKTLDSLLSSINGFIFPGGGVDFGNNTFTNNANYILQKAIQLNENGVHFPVWGTCLGFELLHYLVGGYDMNVLKNVEGEENVTRSIEIVQPNSELYKYMPVPWKIFARIHGSVYYAHHQAVEDSSYKENTKLGEFFNINAYTQGVNSTYIASVEAKKYPFFATQFHPEKNSYEWRVDAPHSPEAIQIAQYFSSLFVQHARLNNQTFSSDDELNKWIIYNQLRKAFPNDYFMEVYLPKNFKSESN